MRRFALVKFCFVSVGMLILVTLAFDLLGVTYRFLFRTPVPPTLIFILIGVSLFACLISFVYRYAYEGHDTLDRPIRYPEMSAKLEAASFFGFFSALVLIWDITSQWWGWAWVAMYCWGWSRISSVAEKRVFAVRLRQAKILFPEMTPAEQEERAIAWLRSGMDPVEYELQQGRSSK
jgi:hypothetical protein